MLMTFEEASRKIAGGANLHIAGAAELLARLPRGSWAGGSTAYFMTKEGGMAAGGQLFVTDFPYKDFKVVSYGADTVKSIAADAFDHGFTIAAIPFGCAAHRVYAEEASGFDSMYIKNVAGWITGGVSGQAPVTVNGLTGETYADKAIALHIGIPENKAATVGIINIFSQDEDSPIIEFIEDGFRAVKCLVNGEETLFADYVAKNGIDVKLPIVGDYSGTGVNVSFRSIESGAVNFYAPVFKGIKYRIAKSVPDYAEEFNSRLSDHMSDLEAKAVFSCNSVGNYLHGGLEGKSTEHFAGPVTLGEIAYQLGNQTLVYITVL